MSILGSLSKDLPANPGPALYEFAHRVEGNIVQRSGTFGESKDFREITFFMRSFAKRFDVQVTFPAKNPSVPDADFRWMAACVNAVMIQLEALGIGTDVDKVISEYETLHLENTFGVARLNTDEKKKIHAHINKMRTIIEASTLSERKKNALFERLNELAKEVDAIGTKTDRFFAFAGDFAFVAGDMATKAKPLFDEVRAILRLVSRSRARQEGISLPPGDEPLLLAPPEVSESDDHNDANE